jgi:hypothetical protein
MTGSEAPVGPAGPGLGDLQALEVARCPDCGRLSWYPRPVCVQCNGATQPWREYLPGRVYSVTEVHRTPAEFADFAPYSVALVTCDAQIQVLAQVRGARIDDRVIVGALEVPGHGLIPFAVGQAADVVASSHAAGGK